MDDNGNEPRVFGEGEHRANLKGALEHLHRVLGEVEDAGRKLKNQNFADLIGAARGRIAMAREHPDLVRVDEQLHADNRGAEFNPDKPFPPEENSALNPFDPGRMLQHQEAGRRADVADAPGTRRPGDPELDFQRQNPGFRHPDNVELNPDGTLKTAPNALGQTDDREKK